MILVEPIERNDALGLGHYGAPRGSRTHKGIDFAVFPGSLILAPVNGIITKYGYPYRDDLSWRYIEITQSDCAPYVTTEEDKGDCAICGRAHPRHRLFYVAMVEVYPGEHVYKGQKIGYLQNIAQRYPGMTPHVHYEIKINKRYIDPSTIASS